MFITAPSPATPPRRRIRSDQRDAAADETFPPLTTSLATFVKDGSDREF
jgi:hypothetical protein